MNKLLMVLMILMPVSLYAVSEEMLSEWKRTTWRLNILLSSQSVHGGVVQFAIIENDPRDSFKQDYAKLKARAIKEKRYDEDSEFSILSVAWDIQFRNVKGDEVNLLYKNELCGFSSNNPVKKYYLVTRTSIVKDKPAVWIIPLETEIGLEQDITLDDGNFIYLYKIAE